MIVSHCYAYLICDSGPAKSHWNTSCTDINEHH